MDSPTTTHSEFSSDTTKLSVRASSPSPSRPSSAIVPDVNSRSPGRGLDHQPVRSSALRNTSEQPSSWLSYVDREGTPVRVSAQSQQDLEARMRAMSPVSIPSDMSRHGSPRTHALSSYHNAFKDEHEMSSSADLTMALPPQYDNRKPSLKPLAMNPPTPRTYTPNLPNIDTNTRDESLEVRPLSVASHHTPDRRNVQSGVGLEPPAYADTPATHQSTTTSLYETPQTVAIRRFEIADPDSQESYSRPSSFIGSGAKSRYYGNLHVSVGATHSNSSPTRDISQQSFELNDDIGGLHDKHKSTLQPISSPNFEVYASDSDDDQSNNSPRRTGVAQTDQIEYDPYSSEHHHSHQYTSERAFDEHPEHFPHDVQRDIHTTHAQLVGADLTATPLHSNSPGGRRHVSNSTGYDLHEGYAGLSAEFGRGMAARRREVSGKIAEEGRAGGSASVSAARATRQGAAGWERFKGL